MSGKYMIQVNETLCKGQTCALCQYACTQGVWPLREAQPEACNGCRRCVFFCPEMAIDVAEGISLQPNTGG
jgi:NAD-dependent dihydropyrimidine dehydrogenase PreA subunit